MLKLSRKMRRKFLLCLWHYAYKAGYAIRRTECNAFPDQARLLNKTEVKVILDVGANRGDTVAEYRRLFPHASIHAFEPIPQLANGLTDRFSTDAATRICEAAISSQVGHSSFYVNSGEDTSSLLETDLALVPDAYASIQRAKRKIDVRTMSLDWYCMEQDITQVDLLKLDIQGGELAALQGAERMLRSHGIKVIYTEAFLLPFYKNQPLLGDICQFLGGCGYALHGLYNVSFSGATGRCTWMDAIFVAPTLLPYSRQLLSLDVGHGSL